jgi:hypothetical protein
MLLIFGLFVLFCFWMLPRLLSLGFCLFAFLLSDLAGRFDLLPLPLCFFFNRVQYVAAGNIVRRSIEVLSFKLSVSLPQIWNHKIGN